MDTGTALNHAAEALGAVSEIRGSPRKSLMRSAERRIPGEGAAPVYAAADGGAVAL